MNSTSDSTPLRRLVYALFITLAAGMLAGNILMVARFFERHVSPAEPTPTQGDNDRSRWDTVRALVDDGTYVIGHRDIVPGTGRYHDRGIITEDGWKTLDSILNPDTRDFYSSKPPLLPTLLAGEYWVLKRAFGWSIVEDRWSVIGVILLTINWLPMLVYFVLLARLADRLGVTDWGRLYVLAAGCFATLLNPFAVTLNNHTVATCCALFALYPAFLIWSEPHSRARWFVLAGFFAGFTACNEFPAAAFLGLLFFVLLVQAPRPTLLFFIPAAALPVAAHLVTNYLALGLWAPAYAKFGTEWYGYEGSHWKIDPNQVQHGIDWAYQSESKAIYLFHMLLGHHGLFSLTPIYLLSAGGMINSLVGWKNRSKDYTNTVVLAGGAKTIANGEGHTTFYSLQPRVGALSLLLTVVVVAFYAFAVMDRNRNYGGWTAGLRWLMWLTPFWLLSMLPVADWLAARRWGRRLAYLFLAVSVFSTTYPARNPWRHPWLYNVLEASGWFSY